MIPTTPRKRRIAALLVSALLLSATAGAYRSLTHAGLTEDAALASGLHQLLGERLGQPLGLYEPLRLDERAPDTALLRERLARIDPAGGYAPVADQQTALGWLVAGAALEGIPGPRARHHFYDPMSGAGLHPDGGPLHAGVENLIRGAAPLHSVLTGAGFDGSGVAAPSWIAAKGTGNDWGLERFLEERQRAASAPSAAERQGALARALLAAGAILHVLQDMGDPARVRNDPGGRGELGGDAYAERVEQRYGRLGLPPASGDPVIRQRLLEFFHDHQGGGLADRTQRRFFSAGTLPGSGPGAGSYPEPRVEAGSRAAGYASSPELRHLLAFQRTAKGVRWWLDERCLGDYAATLLPETARYTAGLLGFLFRGRLELIRQGDELRVLARELGLGKGVLSLYADGSDGRRARLAARPVRSAEAGVELARFPQVPAGRLIAVFRGHDAAGEPLVISDELAPTAR